MKNLMIFLTFLVIGFCLDYRTNHFHPVVIQARLGGFAKPDLRGWPELVILLLVFVIGCIVISSFLMKKDPPD